MIKWVSLFVFLLPVVKGHSWLECTDYEVEDGEYYDPSKCHGIARCGERQQRSGFGVDTGFDFRPRVGTASCQCKRSVEEEVKTTYVPGQRVCVAYPPKNHVAAHCQNKYIPDAGISFFRSKVNAVEDPAFRKWPVEYPHGNGQHQNGQVDYKGFQNCPKFCENNDKALCTACFDLEKDIAPGNYTFHWEWNFNGPDDSYSSCWEAQVVHARFKKQKVLPSSIQVKSRSPIAFSTAKNDGFIYANGKKFMIKGANWFGFEEKTFMLHGLWGDMTIEFALNFLKSNGFNAIRMPYAVSSVLSNPIPHADTVSSAPELIGKSMLDAMEYIIQKAGEQDILVMLDAHRLRPEDGIDDLWYDELTSEQDAENAWKILASKFCNQWNVFAADIKNEPHGVAEWGTNTNKDWRLAAERLGNSILNTCPRWLIFVEGVEKNIADNLSTTENGWWGGKLQGVSKYPVRLQDDSKLVYSPHVYGPSVFAKDSFTATDFPQNLLPIWDQDFGNTPKQSGKPIVIGEWGGHFVHKDTIWQKRITSYFIENNIGNFYWCLNPNSGDTGGLLLDDWKTPAQSKLDLLSSCPSTSVSLLF